MPLGNMGGDKGAEAEGSIGLGEAGQAAVGGEATTTEGGAQRQRRWGGERMGRYGRIKQHRSSPLFIGCRATPPYHEFLRCRSTFMNDPGYTKGACLGGSNV